MTPQLMNCRKMTTNESGTRGACFERIAKRLSEKEVPECRQSRQECRSYNLIGDGVLQDSVELHA